MTLRHDLDRLRRALEKVPKLPRVETADLEAVKHRVAEFARQCARDNDPRRLAALVRRIARTTGAPRAFVLVLGLAMEIGLPASFLEVVCERLDDLGVTSEQIGALGGAGRAVR